MKVIWKYDVPEIGKRTSMAVPPGKVVRVGLDGGAHPCMWVEIDTKTQIFPHRKFVAVATGAEVPDNSKYLGSFELEDEIMWTIWHVYELSTDG